MLAFTTYHIPEAPKNQTQAIGKWLFFLLNEALTEEKSLLLGKIATALNAHAEGQVAVCQVADPVSFHDIISSEPSLVISFGVPTTMFGLHIDLPAAGLRLLEKHACILTYSMVELEKNATHKKSLWRDMQLYLSTQRND